MNYPISVIADKTAQDIDEYVAKLQSERGIGDDIMELVLYKTLSEIQRRKGFAYTNTIINNMNKADDLEKQLAAEKDTGSTGEGGKADEQGVHPAILEK